MALLRCTGEFIAKIIYCLQSDNGQGSNVDERVELWRKSTLQQDKKFCEILTDKYTGNDRNKIKNRIKEVDNEIAKIKTGKLPSTAHIFEEVLVKIFLHFIHNIKISYYEFVLSIFQYLFLAVILSNIVCK